ncbi:hypothetical protein M231_02846 [Tremella mesenterica]|uniref:Magnesium transporter n=1 Tax=Tremella mesenterica TaxID=5217 RepID=A0A4Q1BQ43_TREME|nr:hypothetical protein M231_02846 [Tremella mesenterica]
MTHNTSPCPSTTPSILPLPIPSTIPPPSSLPGVHTSPDSGLPMPRIDTSLQSQSSQDARNEVTKDVNASNSTHLNTTSHTYPPHPHPTHTASLGISEHPSNLSASHNPPPPILTHSPILNVQPEFAELLTPLRLRRKRRHRPPSHHPNPDLTNTFNIDDSHTIHPPGPSKQGWYTDTGDLYRGATSDPFTNPTLPPAPYMTDDDAITFGSSSSSSSSASWASGLERGRKATMAVIGRVGEVIGVRRASSTDSHDSRKRKRMSMSVSRMLTRSTSASTEDEKPKREYKTRKRGFVLLLPPPPGQEDRGLGFPVTSGDENPSGMDNNEKGGYPPERVIVSVSLQEVMGRIRTLRENWEFSKIQSGISVADTDLADRRERGRGRGANSEETRGKGSKPRHQSEQGRDIRNDEMRGRGERTTPFINPMNRGAGSGRGMPRVQILKEESMIRPKSVSDLMGLPRSTSASTSSLRSLRDEPNIGYAGNSRVIRTEYSIPIQRPFQGSSLINANQQNSRMDSQARSGSPSQARSAIPNRTTHKQTDMVKKPRRKGCWWLDVSCPTWQDLRDLGELLSIHPLTLEDVLQQDPREKLDTFQRLGYYFVVVRALDEGYFKYTPGGGSSTSVASSNTMVNPQDLASQQLSEKFDSSHPISQPEVKDEKVPSIRMMAKSEKKTLGEDQICQTNTSSNPQPELQGEQLIGNSVPEEKDYHDVETNRKKSSGQYDISPHSEAVRKDVTDNEKQGPRERLEDTEVKKEGRRRGWGMGRTLKTGVKTNSSGEKVEIIEDNPGKEGLEGLGVGGLNVYLVVFADGIVSFHNDDISKHTKRVLDRVLSLASEEHGSDWIAHGLLDSIVDAFFPLVRYVDGEVDEIDSLTIDPSTDPRNLHRNLHLPAESETTLIPSSPTLNKYPNPVDPIILKPSSFIHAPIYDDNSRDYGNEQMTKGQGETQFGLKVKLVFTYLRLFFLPTSSATRPKHEKIAQAVYDRSTMLRRIMDTRRLVTGLSRLLGAKHQVIGKLRKRATESGGGVEAYIGDVEDHVLLLQTSLNHYEAILSHCQPAYLSQLRVSFAFARGGTDQAILALSTVSMSILPMMLVIGAFSMNIHVPRNGSLASPHREPDGSIAPYNVFACVVVAIFLIGCAMVLQIRYWRYAARTKWAARRQTGVPGFWSAFWGWA